MQDFTTGRGAARIRVRVPLESEWLVADLARQAMFWMSGALLVIWLALLPGMFH